MTKKLISIFIMALIGIMPVNAVLKEKNLGKTLSILRTELTRYHLELEKQAEEQRKMQEDIRKELFGVLNQANQNSLMLYSQKSDYIFDLTYACNEATERYREFKKNSLPFRKRLNKNNLEVARYDSLILNLSSMPIIMMNDQERIDRNVCLTLAVNIRRQLAENQERINEYINYYSYTESKLKTLNDYANKRYGEIQTSIFKNGDKSYFNILKELPYQLRETQTTIEEKYKPYGKLTSDWDPRMIGGLFMIIAFYGIIAMLLNLFVFRLVLTRLIHKGIFQSISKQFMEKRTCIILAMTVITFAAILGIIRATIQQNFIIMASKLLVSFAWLMGVILISLLARVNGQQIKSAFRIYSPLLLMCFLVISFRIILIPNDLVALIFPPVILCFAAWQWYVIKKHHQNVPRSDIFYSYLSLAVFIASIGCSWTGYTLLSVQILIWWIMQLTCILSITCISDWIKMYAKRKHYDEKPITKTWLHKLISNVILPCTGVLSILYSIYWAAGVFNLSDLCWKLFSTNFIDFKNLQVSILKMMMVINLYFLFSYTASTILALMRQHYQQKDPTTAASREVMGKNVIQVLVWGIWLLLSLSILNISVSWLLAISGGLSTGIGFASKDIIENIYYGASLMAGRIKVGDIIEIDGVMGKVTSISYTSTVMESLTGEVITFQNSQLFAKNYKNLTRNHGYVLAAIPFGVAYGSNIKDVSTLVEEAVSNLHHPFLDPEKKPSTVVYEMGDNSINMKLCVWAEAIKKNAVISDVMKCVYDTLNAHNIEIPFPQRDVHIINKA